MVIAIIGLLAALLLPSLASARQKAKKTGCLSNLRQVGIAMVAYSSDHDGRIPFGPNAGAFTSPMNLYPSTGAPTSLISLGQGAPAGLGLLLSHHLGSQGRVLFCPGNDQPMDAAAQLANVGKRQAQSSYYYRHAGNTRIFDGPTGSAVAGGPKLDSLGSNRDGLPIRALAIDTQFLAPPAMVTFGIRPSTHHQQRFADVLYSDGHTSSHPNTTNRFTVDLVGNANLYSAFDMILAVFERADRLP